MKSTSFAVACYALLAAVQASTHDHGHHHLRHHLDAEIAAPLERKGGQCQFPTDAGLVAVAPNEKNAGWAMSPDQTCLPGHYCPYACPPGQVSMQWDPDATSYSYPQSMNGGLYCDDSGNIQKPFPDRSYCQQGTGSVVAVNKCGDVVAFCQTVLPGSESMLIPTLIKDLATLAVPDTNYWCSTAAHFYINPPGISSEVACVWGTSSNNWGNWSPYVAGANADGHGRTFLKIGWNPIYLEPATPFRNVVPSFGVEIVCSGQGCNGLPCKIDPSIHGVNEMQGSSSAGAGGATFCVVTVPQGQQANIVVFESGNGNNSGNTGGNTNPPSQPSTTSSTSSTSTTTSSTTSLATSLATSSTASSVTNSVTNSVTSSITSSGSSLSSGTTGTSSANAASPTQTITTKVPLFSDYYGSVTPPLNGPTLKTAPPGGSTYGPHVFAETPVSSVVPATSAAAVTAGPGAAPLKQGAASSIATSMMSLALSLLITGILPNF
ncbi:hypothetical protein Egran_01617 [Elaphomyces granulatus]|uniref:SUN domain-containing protein n=1 Tax=Elaphomyces granulatus TaxID=519963 RepID=A0A232M2N0_9EURO|nr:hypothetical protein Egran_01617 [Elaphomyces granulatus]